MKFTISPPDWQILCVDDDVIYTVMYERYLKEAGYQVRIADSGESALELVKNYTPDLIITDVVMPGIDGLELSQRLREDPRFSTAIILVISGTKKDGETAVLALDGGADDYLLKPFNKDEFVAKVRSFLRIKALQDEMSKKNKTLQETLIELEREKEILNSTLKQLSLISDRLEAQNEKLNAANQEQIRRFDSLVTILSTLIENRLKYHRGHAAKVAEIAAYMAKKLDLADTDIRQIEIAALLHEIGKFGIPDKLIEKRPDQYSISEKEILEQHPVSGADLLKSYPGFETVSKIIRHIHERYDGNGVPSQLKADAIPLGSRIISVANYFESRQRQDASADFAEELLYHSQTRFDPGIVRLMNQYIEQYHRDNSEDIYNMRLYDLKPGMVLAQDVFTKSGIKLMLKDTKLTEELIERVARYNRIDPIETDIFIQKVKK
jgi:putative nucleotidyltransferase with HDIG domain